MPEEAEAVRTAVGEPSWPQTSQPAEYQPVGNACSFNRSLQLFNNNSAKLICVLGPCGHDEGMNY